MYWETAAQVLSSVDSFSAGSVSEEGMHPDLKALEKSYGAGDTQSRFLLPPLSNICCVRPWQVSP